MGDESNGRPAKRPRTRATASRLNAPQRSPPRAEPAFDPTLGGPTVPQDEDILRLYQAVTWPASLNFRQIVEPTPLPSPFSPILPEWLNNTAGDPLGGYTELYDLVLLNAGQLQDMFAQQDSSFGSDSKLSGFFCWAEYTNPLGVGDGEENPKGLNGFWVDRLGLNSLQLYFGTLSFPLQSRADILKRDLRTEPGQNRYYQTQDLKIYGLEKKSIHAVSGAVEYNYYILNDFEKRFSVNGIPIAKGTVAGPLPDFAIIDINGFFALWWATQEGIEYVPGRTEEVYASPSIEIPGD